MSREEMEELIKAMKEDMDAQERLRPEAAALAEKAKGYSEEVMEATIKGPLNAFKMCYRGTVEQLMAQLDIMDPAAFLHLNAAFCAVMTLDRAYRDRPQPSADWVEGLDIDL